jgi:hypothetical protein
MDRQPLVAMGRHYPGKALQIRIRPNWQIAIAWGWFSFERTRLSQSAARVWQRSRRNHSGGLQNPAQLKEMNHFAEKFARKL